jgi:hypothetical protein
LEKKYLSNNVVVQNSSETNCIWTLSKMQVKSVVWNVAQPTFCQASFDRSMCDGFFEPDEFGKYRRAYSCHGLISLHHTLRPLRLRLRLMMLPTISLPLSLQAAKSQCLAQYQGFGCAEQVLFVTISLSYFTFTIHFFLFQPYLHNIPDSQT